MFFWNIQELAHQLHHENETISQEEKSQYYLASICGVYCMYMLLALFPSAPIVLFSTLGILAGLIAVPWCLKLNRQNDNKHFIERMVCLGFVATVHILVYSLIFALIGMLLNNTLLCNSGYQPTETVTSIINGMLILCIHAAFYIIVGYGLRYKK